MQKNSAAVSIGLLPRIASFNIYVFRCTSQRFLQLEETREQLLKAIVAEVKGKTKYVRMAPLEEAPLNADCLTLIHYLFKKALGIDIPLTLVGDMPRTLFKLGEWKLLSVDETSVCCGDLCFVKRIQERKLICHAALFLGPNEVFHCKRDVGAIVENFENFCFVFEQKLLSDQISYIDIRNRELRKMHGNIFLPESEII